MIKLLQTWVKIDRNTKHKYTSTHFTYSAFWCGSLICALIYHPDANEQSKGSASSLPPRYVTVDRSPKSQQAQCCWMRVTFMLCWRIRRFPTCFRQFAEFIGTAQTNTTNERLVCVCVRACVRYMRFTSNNTMQNSLIHCIAEMWACVRFGHCIHMHTSTYINYFLLFSFAIGIPYPYLVQHETWLTENGTSEPAATEPKPSCDGNRRRYWSWNKQTQLESCLVLVELLDQSVVLLFVYPSSSSSWPRHKHTKPVFNFHWISLCVFGERAKFSFWTFNSIEPKCPFSNQTIIRISIFVFELLEKVKESKRTARHSGKKTEWTKPAKANSQANRIFNVSFKRPSFLLVRCVSNTIRFHIETQREKNKTLWRERVVGKV